MTLLDMLRFLTVMVWGIGFQAGPTLAADDRLRRQLSDDLHDGLSDELSYNVKHDHRSVVGQLRGGKRWNSKSEKSSKSQKSKLDSWRGSGGVTGFEDPVQVYHSCQAYHAEFSTFDPSNIAKASVRAESFLNCGSGADLELGSETSTCTRRFMCGSFNSLAVNPDNDTTLRWQEERTSTTSVDWDLVDVELDDFGKFNPFVGDAFDCVPLESVGKIIGYTCVLSTHGGRAAALNVHYTCCGNKAKNGVSNVDDYDDDNH